MKYAELKKIREQSAQWPSFAKSWDDVSPDTRSLVVDRKIAKSLEPLSRFTKLQNLFVHGLRECDFQHVSAVASLKRLLVWKLDATRICGFNQLANLESLGVYHAPRLTSFSGIEGLRKLRHLFFHNVPKVRSLDPFSKLTSLEELVLEQSLATNKLLTLASLKPIHTLKKLKCLDLRGVHVEDGSLEPLTRLPKLHYLFPCTLAMDVLELAKLAKKINAQLAREDRIGPTRNLEKSGQFGRCKKCKKMQQQLVGKTGNKYRLLACPQCDKELIQERKAIFESAR